MGNREALLEAAIVCLREHGFGGTRARDLASTAGVSLGAIRYHFGSTEALLNAAIVESSRRWIKSFQTSMAADAETGVADAADGLYDVFEAHRELLAGFVEAFAHAQRSEHARRELASYYDEFRRDIAAALGGGSGAESVASILLALVDGLMVQWILDPSRRPEPDVLRRAVGALAAATR
ncbi:transcriptional regulator [Mycobacterium sp. MFM001]|uniref:TetR/AcrR family transcriptional regulator n=1 Tax=Mycobacterium sp. MFM001 TaxID=2049453 RepID=UPI000DA4C319|nr:TetR/AcrR family transcriptional regulator [Mycobacterium sp. MFM001]GBE63598.1 transcriptional regulator [Mycobacterium sp. MFM001]